MKDQSLRGYLRQGGIHRLLEDEEADAESNVPQDDATRPWWQSRIVLFLMLFIAVGIYYTLRVMFCEKFYDNNDGHTVCDEESDDDDDEDDQNDVNKDEDNQNENQSEQQHSRDPSD